VRTTIDLDPVILKELKERQTEEGKTLGQLVSELLAVALAERHEPLPPLRWITRDLQPRVDLQDKDALFALLDADDSDE
jgi:hypothetical protein